MSSQALYEELDVAVEAILRGRAIDTQPEESETIDGLLPVADLLRSLPDPDFRRHLGLQMQAEAAALHRAQTHVRSADRRPVLIAQRPAKQAEDDLILPTLFGAGGEAYPVHQSSFVVSGLLHAAMIAIVLASSVWIARHHDEVKQQVISLIGPLDYSLPVAKTHAGGGGGGGDHDLLPASKGTPPRLAREQITPPAIVVRNESPKLAVEPTVVGPPEIKLPQSPNMGDRLSALLAPSNGPGGGGGIGNGTGGGLGSGTGPGVGPGHGGGYGGGAYRVGGGVSAPRVLSDPDPEYSEEARQAKYQGTVVLWVVIDPEGRPRDVRVSRALGMGLDEKAVEAVRKWRFQPAMKDGHPVAVIVNIEVNFRLY
jgi:TonB family protein